MSNTFNIQRFGLLLKRQWLEFGKIYLISLGVALGIMITVYGFTVIPFFDEDRHVDVYHQLSVRVPLFIILGFLFISVIASSYFAHLGQKSKAIIDLMIPASTFEKFVAGIFFTGFLSSACFVVIFYLTDLAFITSLKNHVGADADKAIFYFFSDQYILKEATPFFIYVVPFFVTSIFLLGSVYFDRFHYIKTAISVLIFSGIWSFIVIKTGEWLFHNKRSIQMNSHQNAENTTEWLIFGLFMLLTLVFWSITYVRLKEKEV